MRARLHRVAIELDKCVPDMSSPPPMEEVTDTARGIYVGGLHTKRSGNSRGGVPSTVYGSQDLAGGTTQRSDVMRPFLGCYQSQNNFPSRVVQSRRSGTRVSVGSMTILSPISSGTQNVFDSHATFSRPQGGA